ncbi:protein IpgF [Geobacter sp. OR-1]|nr:protein IpgF [Geobacter sp. OR-1]
MQYEINPQILRAIAQVESRFNPRAVNWNSNGSYDFGVMQINSSWGHTYGEKWWSTLGDPCTNIKAGAMILAACMKKYGYSWEAIGCYNSQTPGKRNKYAITVFRQLQRIERDDRLNAAKTSMDIPKEIPSSLNADLAENDPKSRYQE